jgi:uncharacterized RDD family membrane protein YckC
MRDRRFTVLSPFRWAWRYTPVFLALLPYANWIGCLILAAQRRSKKWLFIGLDYLAVWILCAVLVHAGNRTGPGHYEHEWAIAIGTIGFIGVWLWGLVHLFRNRIGQKPASAPDPRPRTPAEARAAAVANLRSLDSRRLGARLIDALITSVAAVMVAVIIGGVTWATFLLLAWIQVVYFFVCEATTGQTIGKRLLGLRVVAPDGSPPRPNGIAAREVLRLLEEPVLAPIVLVASGRRRQRIGDFFGGTTVGRGEGTQTPDPSPLRILYPAFWAVCGVGFLLLVPPPPVHETTPAAAKKEGYTVEDRIPYREQIFEKQMENLCIEQNQLTQISPPPDLHHELTFEHMLVQNIAHLRTPPRYAGVKQSVLDGGRSLDGEPGWLIHFLSSHRQPVKTFLRIATPQMRQAVIRGWRPQPHWTAACGF